MDRELSESARQKKIRNRVIKIALLCLTSLFILSSLRLIIKASVIRTEIQTATVEIGNIETSVTASGIVMPEFEEIKTSPVQSVIKEIFRTSGDKVKNGDTILSLDTKITASSLGKLRDELNIKKNNIRQHEFQLGKNLIDLRTQYEIKRLQVDNMVTELEEEKYLNTIGGGTRDRIEKAELNLKISQLELEQISQTIQNQEESIQADLLGLNYEIIIQQKNVNELQDKLDQSTVIADKNGVIIWINNQVGKNINPGDELVKIADLQSYEVNGSISDIHAGKLETARQVIVRLNENTDIRGKIVTISPSVSGHTVNFKIRLDNKSHVLLRPNLRVDVFVITSFEEKVKRLRKGGFYKGGVRQIVFVVKDDELIGRQVTFGGNNSDFIKVVNGLTEGDEVVISDMSDYERHERLRLK